jgi:hypothetical protein
MAGIPATIVTYFAFVPDKHVLLADISRLCCGIAWLVLIVAFVRKMR